MVLASYECYVITIGMNAAHKAAPLAAPSTESTSVPTPFPNGSRIF